LWLFGIGLTVGRRVRTSRIFTPFVSIKHEPLHLTGLGVMRYGMYWKGIRGLFVVMWGRTIHMIASPVMNTRGTLYQAGLAS